MKFSIFKKQKTINYDFFSALLKANINTEDIILEYPHDLYKVKEIGKLNKLIKDWE